MPYSNSISMIRLRTIFSSILSLIAATPVLFSSCAEQYNIAGNAAFPQLNGQMLYLKTDFAAERPLIVDSCKVVHGEFRFFGEIDTAVLAQLYIGKESVIPIVLESGSVKIIVDNARQLVQGGKLNERLSRFTRKRDKLENQLWEIDQEYYNKLKNGTASEEDYRDIQRRASKLVQKVEDLETRFVMDNYDNPLGPGFFLMLGEVYPTPVMTNQLQRIYDQAPPQFKRHPGVARFVREARRNNFLLH